MVWHLGCGKVGQILGTAAATLRRKDDAGSSSDVYAWKCFCIFTVYDFYF